MRKINNLIALATLVTVGSVYASWQYVGGSIKQEFFLDGTTNVGITNKVGAEKGALEISRDNFSIVIDDANNDHHAEFSVNGNLTIVYTPANFDALSSDQQENGLELYFQLASTIPAYDGVAVFSVCPNAHQILAVESSGEGSSKVFTYTITQQEIDQALSFYTNVFSDNEESDDGDLFLDTEAEYDAFKANLHAGALSIVIGERSDFLTVEESEGD